MARTLSHNKIVGACKINHVVETVNKDGGKYFYGTCYIYRPSVEYISEAFMIGFESAVDLVADMDVLLDFRGHLAPIKKADKSSFEFKLIIKQVWLKW